MLAVENKRKTEPKQPSFFFVHIHIFLWCHALPIQNSKYFRISSKFLLRKDSTTLFVMRDDRESPIGPNPPGHVDVILILYFFQWQRLYNTPNSTSC